VQLQRLDQLARALVPRRAQAIRCLSAAVVGSGGSGNNKEGRPFEQDGLSRAADLGERRQVFGLDGCVGDDGVHDSRPRMRSLVQTRRVEGVGEGGRGSEKARKARETKRWRTACHV